LDAVSVVPFTVSPTTLVTWPTESVRPPPEPDEDAEGFDDADGVGVALVLDEELEGELAEELDEPPPRRLPTVSPRPPSRPPPLAEDPEDDVEGVLDADDLGADCAAGAPDADGLGAAVFVEPESVEDVPVPLCAGLDAEGAGLAGLAVSLALFDADGDGLAELSLPSSAVTQFLYSSAVMLFEVEGDGDAVLLFAARASEDVKPMPMRTAVGMATDAIALPLGMWNLVNSGFLGAAWRGPVFPQDSSTSVPWVTSSAGTVPPIRPVGRVRS
jgi:hypothetical protein